MTGDDISVAVGVVCTVAAILVLLVLSHIHDEWKDK